MLQLAQGFGVEGAETADVPENERDRDGHGQQDPEPAPPGVLDNHEAHDQEQIQDAEEAMDRPHTAHDRREDALPEQRDELEQCQRPEHGRGDSRGPAGREAIFDLVRQPFLGSRQPSNQGILQRGDELLNDRDFV
jgi:hypothetical protein